MAAFATVGELETFLGVPSLSARGTAMLDHASAAIRSYTHQDLTETPGRQESYAGDALRWYIQLTQSPVTAVSAITIDAVAFTEFSWTRWGLVWRTDDLRWEDGPVIVTYDSGYAAASDEMAGIKTICLEVAARAMTGSPDTFGLEVQELRGPAPAVFLTEEEKRMLDGLTIGAMVA